MTSFLSHNEISVSKEFERNGFIIADIKDKKLIHEIRKLFSNFIKKKIQI